MSSGTAQKIGTIAGIGLLLCLALGIYVMPLSSASGVIDTTKDVCGVYTGTTTKHYHILLGQLDDYQLVKRHLSKTAPTGCGQSAHFKLYL